MKLSEIFILIGLNMSGKLIYMCMFVVIIVMV